MLNERRVRHMVKLASYEMKYGKEDMKASTYFKNDYISLNLLFTFLWTTVSYILIVVLLGLSYMDLLLEDLTMQKMIYMGGAVIGAYVVILVVTLICAGRFYKKKHLKARKRMKAYRGNLERLENMYEQEAR